MRKVIPLLVVVAIAVGLYSAKPVVGAPTVIGDQLAGKSRNQQKEIVANAIIQANPQGSYSSTEYGIDIEITDIKYEAPFLVVFAKGWKGAEQLGFGADGSVEIERFRLYNPWYQVKGTNDVQREYNTPDGLVSRTEKEMVENPKQAVQEQIARTMSYVGQTGTDIVPGKVGHTTTTCQPDDTTGEDTWIDSLFPDTNYGGNANGFIGDASGESTENGRVIIRFACLSSISATDTVSSATLNLTQLSAGGSHDSAANINVVRLLQAWVEAQATWNVYSTGNSWGTAGASASSTDRDATLTDTTTSGAGLTWNGANMVTDVQNWVDGTVAVNNGWLIESPNNETAGAANKSVEVGMAANATAGNRPELIVEHAGSFVQQPLRQIIHSF